MKILPGTLQAGGAIFPATHWSMVVAGARDNDPDGPAAAAAQAALNELCRDYWPPLYAFVRRRGYNAHDAQDLTQGFFANLLASKAHARADPARGKFRSFLLALFKHHLSAARERERRLKRGGGQEFVFLDRELAAVEARCGSEPGFDMPGAEERVFEWHWAEALVSRALGALGREYAEGTRARVFVELQPFLTGGVGLPSQEEAAARLGLPVETLRSHLSRLRARYRELLREEVARTVSSAGDVDEELRYLCRVLIASS